MKSRKRDAEQGKWEVTEDTAKCKRVLGIALVQVREMRVGGAQKGSENEGSSALLKVITHR